MNYTIREISQRTGIPASTLRFYETRGLLPRVKRDPHGVRVYDDADLDRLGTITCLKNTGMGVGEMARFMALYEQGDATLAERRELVRAQQQALSARIRAMRDYKRHIDEKLEYYDLACACGSEAEARRLRCCPGVSPAGERSAG